MANTPTIPLQSYIRSDKIQQLIEATIKDDAGDFTTSLLTTINSNPVLQECEYPEVVRTALKAASMHLPLDPGLGLAYLIPYRNKIKTKTVNDRGITIWKEEYKYEPTLQIGWKGFVQLALRTGRYKIMNVTDVRECEYVGLNRLTGQVEWKWEDDEVKRNKLNVVGYAAFFELHDGFSKTLYMTKTSLEEHATKFSQTFRKGYGKWKDDFPAMSRKTVIKLLISSWGPKTTKELRMALKIDQAAMGEDDTYNYLDNDKKAERNQTRADSTTEAEVIESPQDDIDQTPQLPTEPEVSQLNTKEQG